MHLPLVSTVLCMAVNLLYMATTNLLSDMALPNLPISTPFCLQSNISRDYPSPYVAPTLENLKRIWLSVIRLLFVWY